MSRPRKRLLALAGAALVALLVGTSLPAFADPAPGTITGHLTDNGAPVANSFVNATHATTFQSYSGMTDPSGAFTITDVAWGDYRVSFQLPGFVSQYAVQKTSFQDADLISVTEGGVSTVEESVAPHGSISGHVTRADGSPAAFLQVTAQADGPAFPLSTSTNQNGDYTMPTVWPGTYVVSFGGFGSVVQYAHGKASFAAADRFAVTAGAAVTVDETLLPRGAISGRLTQAGQPIMFAQVTVAGPTGPVGSGSTGPDGRYRIEVYPDTYTVEFRLSSGLIQYAHQKRTLQEADRITVAAGPDTVVDEEMLPTATIAGRLVDSTGAAVPFASARISDGSGGLYFAITSFDGSFSVSVPPGTYTVAFVTPYGEQWARGKTSAGSADPIVATGGQTTVLNETLAATGTIVVTAKDHTTGTPVTTFCASASATECTDNGTATLTILPGSHTVLISGAQQGEVSYADASIIGVAVTSGQATPVVAELSRAASVRAVIKDATTGEPVEGACIELVQPLRPTDHDGAGDCSDQDGVVTVRQVRPAIYTAFVEARDAVHGHQWVGYHRGTGAQATARLIPVAEGATVTLPDIKLDRAGTLTGVITDKATGQPISVASVLVSSMHGRRGSGAPGVQAGFDGRYMFSGLGPYDWTLFISAFGHGSQYTGGGANRFLADGAEVNAGQTTTYDIKMSKGTTVTVNVTGPDGEPAPGTDVVFVNAFTGDEMGRAVPDVDPPHTLQVTGPQLVKLRVEGSSEFWVGGSDFIHARLYLIPASGSRTIDVPVP